MKFTCYLCVSLLVISAICGGVYAFSGFDVIKYLSFGSDSVYRSFLAVTAIAALFTIYSMIFFKPFKGLK
ncbi:MAG: hypothetical protein HFK06_06085 [Clostridia bacterium]|jgi:uncharacterized membrane protein YuzA (DUF378 family)|nr:hypothetical protein [Clostridia bacterium]